MTGVQLTVNGKTVQVTDLRPHTTLLAWLRARGLTASKEGCAEGECGACAVMVARPAESGTRWEAVNGCLTLLAALNGAEVWTAEGLGQPGHLHPVQVAMARAGGSQCGYCTPGFVTSMAAEYYREGRAAFDIEALSGNLCRCTGYRPIRDAALSLGTTEADDPLKARLSDPAPQPLETALDTPEGLFLRPATLTHALDLLAQHPTAKLLAGGTDWAVEVNQRFSRAPVTVAVDALPELRTFAWTDAYVEIGAGLNLSEVERRLAGRIPLLAQLFPLFASRLIRNSATLGGNLGTGSPIGDSPPALLALDARVVLAGRSGERELPLADFFTGYRQTQLQPGELIRAVQIPLPLAPVARYYKVAKRRMDDISSVAAAFALTLDGETVSSIRIGLGGVAATPIRAHETEAFLTGRPWTERTVHEAARVLAGEGTPLSDHRASAAYRTAMLEQLLLKFFYEVMEVPT